MRKKSDFNPGQATTAGFILKSMVLLLMTSIICFSACKGKGETDEENKPSAPNVETPVQPLPGGKARFIWVNGNFDTDGTSWQRIWQLSFAASSGKVDAEVWTWKSPDEVGKVPYNSHVCTMDDLTKTCSTYTPYGWAFPAGKSESWTGTYVYNTTTGKLDITWSSPSFAAGAKESWTITNPTTALARASLLSSTYTLTHGRGYGSNSLFTTYKTIAQMVTEGLPNFLNTTSKSVAVSCINDTSAPTIPVIYPSSSTFNTWTVGVMNLSVFNTPSSPIPANTLHFKSSGTGAGVSCSCIDTTRKGFVYHLSSTNTSRAMSYNMWCACLPTNAEFPCYNRGLHALAVSQVLDDNNNLVAIIGLEASNDPGGVGYLYSLQDYNNIPD